MKVAALPDNEALRLRALARCEILDTPAETAFDDLASLAADICATPTALITLVDEQRQWFKSRIAFEPTESIRDVSFCAHAILGRDVMVVTDATRDPRFAGNPLVTEAPHIRFYAGAPLVMPDGYARSAPSRSSTTSRAISQPRRRGRCAR